MKLTPDLKAAAGEPRVLFRASQAPWVVPSVDKDGNKNYVTDGPVAAPLPGRPPHDCSGRATQGRLCPGGLLFRQRRHHRKTGRRPPSRFSAATAATAMIFRDFEGVQHLVLHAPNENRMSGPCSCR